MRISARVTALAAALALAAITASHARAADDPCSHFDWPLDVERAWLTAAKIESLQSGSTLGSMPDQAFSLSLDSDAAKLPVQPSGKPKGDAGKTYSGFVTLPDLPEAGLYQVTISSPGWIDAVQNGVTVATQAHSSSHECASMHKSLRFQLAAGKTVLEFSSVPSASLRFAVRRAN